MEINTPDSENFAESMNDLYSDDFQELIVEPQDGNQAEVLDYLELGEIRKLDNEQVLEIANEALERGTLYATRADDCDRLAELAYQVLYERGMRLE